MLSWLFALCLLVIALCRAAPPPPPMVVVAGVPVVVKSAIGIVTYPAVPTIRAEGDGLPEDPDQRGGGTRRRQRAEGLLADLAVVEVEAAEVPGYLTVTHNFPN
jgi:hypothetical protein